MKKINLLITGTMFFLNSFAQHTPLNDLVNISLPKSAEKLTNEQLHSFISGKTQYFQKTDRRKSKGDFYKINDMIIQLNGDHVNTAKNYLENTKKGFDEMAHMGGNLSTNYTSEIKSLNNYKILIIHQEAQNWAYYNFSSINDSNSSILKGRIEYDKTDKSNRNKAAKMLDQILKSMTFK